MYSAWFFLILSAFLYFCPFVVSQSCWWMVFLFLVPFFYSASQTIFSFKKGFLWGALIWTLHLSGVLYSVYHLADGPFYLRLIPLIIIVVYQAFFVGLWFWITEQLARFLSVTSPLGRLSLWLLTSFVYFYWVDAWSLSAFNTYEGYFLMNPLLPLAEYPQLLFFLPTLGKNGMLALVLLSNAVISYAFITKNRLKYTAVLLLVAAPWFFSMTQRLQTDDSRSQASKIAFVPLIFYEGYNLSALAEYVQEQLADILKKNPQVDLVIFPESSFDRINLNTAHEITKLWSSQYLGKKIDILIGAVYWEKDQTYNAIYWIYDGVLKGVFKKRHTMLLVEGMAPWYSFSAIRSLYHSAIPPVQASQETRPLFALGTGSSVVPYICSELFFNRKPDDGYGKAPIVVVSKDTWALVPWIKRLMFLDARLKAIEWQRPIIYVSYFHHAYFDRSGAAFPLISQTMGSKS